MQQLRLLQMIYAPWNLTIGTAMSVIVDVGRVREALPGVEQFTRARDFVARPISQGKKKSNARSCIIFWMRPSGGALFCVSRRAIAWHRWCIMRGLPACLFGLLPALWPALLHCYLPAAKRLPVRPFMLCVSYWRSFLPRLAPSRTLLYGSFVDFCTRCHVLRWRFVRSCA